MEVNQNYFDLSLKNKQSSPGESYFFGHGKLLISGEYVLLEGAQALALPTKPGQNMSVRYEKSYNDPKLLWRSLDHLGECWFEAEFELWNFEQTSGEHSDKVVFLQKLLRQLRVQNKHFLREEVTVYVETRLGFPKTWGLGSSSTLIYNLSQWAYVSPFELLFKTSLGSGYDVACAQSDGPILYKNDSEGPIYSPVVFDPSFKNNIHFVYLGKKQDTLKEISRFQSLEKNKSKNVISEISEITNRFLQCDNINSFMNLMFEHEKILSSYLSRSNVKDLRFIDFDGAIKSLGAWGGDFVMVVSEKSTEDTKRYFMEKGYNFCLPYKDIIADNTMLNKEISERTYH
jgi:mevalonate kinase